MKCGEDRVKQRDRAAGSSADTWRRRAPQAEPGLLEE